MLFIDTAILMYAAGREHPLRSPCRAVMEAVGERSLKAATSTEVIQEILHRYTSIRRPDGGRGVARAALDLFAPVLAVTHSIAERAINLHERYPTTPARDLIHVATCVDEGIEAIVSPDTHFDPIREITRVDPSDTEGLARFA